MSKLIFIILSILIGTAQGAESDYFKTTWNTDPDNVGDATLLIPINEVFGSYDYDVDWGDGTPVENFVDTDATHTYSQPGLFVVKISGNFPGIYLNNQSYATKLRSLDQWGTISWRSFDRAFWGASNMLTPATDAPDLSQVTSLRSMFKGASVAEPNTSNWNTSAIEDMGDMFDGALQANPDTSNWVTSEVTDMRNMFLNAQAAMPVTTHVTGTGVWDTGKVRQFSGMFAFATSAQPDVENWDTSAATSMDGMFGGMDFAPKVGNWNTSNVTMMTSMFSENQGGYVDVSNWDVSSVTNIVRMFRHVNYTPDVSAWNTGSLERIDLAFAVSIDELVLPAPDISNWDYSNVTSVGGSLIRRTMPVYKYDQLLISLSNHQTLQPGLAFGLSVENLHYCQGEAARAQVESDFGWDFQDDGLDCSLQAPGSAPVLASESDSGLSDTDNVTAVTTPSFDLVCTGAGHDVTLYAALTGGSRVEVASGVCDQVGNITLTSTVLTEGVYFMTYTETNAEGTSPPSPRLDITIDTTAPSAVQAVTPATGFVINNTTPLFSGLADMNTQVVVSAISGQGGSCTGMADVNGLWSCQFSEAINDGDRTFELIATDVAGNVSDSLSVTFTIDSSLSYGLSVSAPDELVTAEDGSTDSFTLSLPLTPTGDVRIQVKSSDDTEAFVTPAQVIFTPENWNLPVTVKVIGVDDDATDSNQSYQVELRTLTSTDADYNGIDPTDLPAINIDDDVVTADLRGQLSNCIQGVRPDDELTYHLLISNEGPTAVSGARVVTEDMLFNLSEISWTCEVLDDAQETFCDQAVGVGALDEYVDLAPNTQLLYMIQTTVTGLEREEVGLGFEVFLPELPVGVVDVTPDNNIGMDIDSIYEYIFKAPMECSAPGVR